MPKRFNQQLKFSVPCCKTSGVKNSLTGFPLFRTADRQDYKCMMRPTNFPIHLGLQPGDLKFSKFKCPQEKSKGNNWKQLWVNIWLIQYVNKYILIHLSDWRQEYETLPLLKTHFMLGVGNWNKHPYPWGMNRHRCWERAKGTEEATFPSATDIMPA